MLKLILALTLLPVFCFSQPEIASEKSNIDSVPARFNLDVLSLRDHIYKKIPLHYKDVIQERKTFLFAYRSAYRISNLISSGRIYNDWEEFETYLNKVFQKVIPDFLKADTMIHAYIYRNGEANAFMTPSGHSFINIGLLAHINNEATLAGILAHELAHYYMQHSLKSFIKDETTPSLGLIAPLKKQDKYSIQQELQADSLAMILHQQSGYDLSGLVDANRLLERLEKQAIRKSPEDWELKAVTHPLSEERLENLYEFIRRNGDQPGLLYQVSEQQFLKFKENSKQKILSTLLYNFSYNNCIETAFKFHLLDPDNLVYIYFLLEAIRRECYLFPEVWGKNFITHRYYNTRTNPTQRSKTKYEQHLFEKFDVEIMALTPEEIRDIKARFYWENEPKFATYEQAFVFFYRVSQALNCSECILSNALSQVFNKSKRDSLLSEYLRKEDIHFPNFAKNLLNDSLIDGLSNKKLTVFNSLYSYVRLGKDDIPINNQTSLIDQTMQSIIDSIRLDFPERIPLYLRELKRNNLTHYLMLLELQELSLSATVSKGYRAELHILDPRFLKVFYQYNVNEIEFVNCVYAEYRNPERDMDAYDAVINMDHRTYFIKRIATDILRFLFPA